MPPNAFDPWGPIGACLSDLTSDQVQVVVGRAGLALNWDLSAQQDYSHLTRVREFKRRIEEAYRNLTAENQATFVANLASEIIKAKPELEQRLTEALNRIGWTIVNGSVISIELLDPADLANIPETSQPDLLKAADRIKGDPSGVLTSACGAIDRRTSEIFTVHGLGRPEDASFQERVNRALVACGALDRVERQLVAAGMEQEKARIARENLKGAISHAAYVMQSLRSDLSDAHGTRLTTAAITSNPALATLVFDSLKWSMVICSLLRDA
jgi:hypothetical protein